MSMRLHNIHLMRYYEEVLAQAARNYAFTGNKKWEQRYRMLGPESELDKGTLIHILLPVLAQF